jgi:hypothetical protein
MLSEQERKLKELAKLNVEKELARRDLVDYMGYKFRYYHLKPFKVNWHHGYIAEHLKACNMGQIRRLMIEEPPSYGKSEQVVRSNVSFTLGQNPKFKFAYTSYGGDLTESVSVETRDWVKSKVYQGLFDIKISRSAEQKTDWKTEEGGGLFATTIGGAITGRHFNGIIVDDPLKANEAYSKAAREEVHSYFKNSIISRLEEFDEANAYIIIIMQRLHPDDLVGRLLREQGDMWTRISLPALNQKPVTYCYGGFEYRREANEPLFAAKHSIERLAELEIEMGPAVFKTQMLQDPEISEAGFFVAEWLPEIGLAELPEQNVYIFVDPAMSTKESADDRGIVVEGWSQRDEMDMVTYMDGWSGKWELDIFLEYIVEAMILYPEADVDIEGAGGGILVGQELPKRIAQHNSRRRAAGKSLIRNRVTVTPPSNKIPKVQKIAQMQPYAQNGQIRIRRGANEADKFIAQMCAFSPDKTHNKDDMIDPFSNGWLIASPKIEKQRKNDEDLRWRKKSKSGGWNV